MINYDKLLKICEERHITSYTIKQNKVIGQATWKKIMTGGTIDTVSLNSLCKFLDCQPGDLLAYVPDDGTQGEA